MDTQNTPVHIKLWHREFWMMALANLFLMMSAYMLIPALPPYLLHTGFSCIQVGEVMGAYGIGIFILGGFCSYLVQRYRRNRVCQYSMLAAVLSIGLLYYIDFVLHAKMEFWMLIVARLVQGACVGLAQMTLASTLIIDTCESFQRTEANYTAAWFSRFALSVGPVVSLLVFKFFNYEVVLISAGVVALLAWLLVALVKFPFKAPSDNMSVYSLDRFFLPQGFLLFVNIAMVTTVVGMLFSLQQSETFYGMLMLGFIVALLAEKYAFPDADLKSEVLTGLILMIAAVLIYFTNRESAILYITPSLIGFSIGIIGSRFLLFYIKLAKHCQRGTSQSSFFLAWEFGISLGLFLGIGFLGNHAVAELQGYLPTIHVEHEYILLVCLAILVVSLLFYNFCVHPWYMKHRNR